MVVVVYILEVKVYVVDDVQMMVHMVDIVNMMAKDIVVKSHMQDVVKGTVDVVKEVKDHMVMKQLMEQKRKVVIKKELIEKQVIKKVVTVV